MIEIGELARTYGYPAVVIGTIFQGETALIILGLLAHEGYLSVWWIWLLAAVVAMIGDQTYFALGRHYGERFIAKLPKRWQGSLFEARDLISRNPTRTLLLMRFLTGFRNVVPIICGTSSIPRARFVRYNVFTALLWSGIFVGTGFLFGAAATEVIGKLQHVELLLIGVIFVLGSALPYLSRRLRKRIKQNTEEHR